MDQVDSLPVENYVDYITVGDVANLLGVSIDTVRRWEKAGKLKAERLDGKNRYFAVHEIEAFKSAQPLSTSEVAKLLGISVSSVRRLEASGELVPSRDEKSRRQYTQAQVDAYKQPADPVVEQPNTIQVPVVAYEPEVPEEPANEQLVPEEPQYAAAEEAVALESPIEILEEELEQGATAIENKLQRSFSSFSAHAGNLLSGFGAANQKIDQPQPPKKPTRLKKATGGSIWAKAAFMATGMLFGVIAVFFALFMLFPTSMAGFMGYGDQNNNKKNIVQLAVSPFADTALGLVGVVDPNLAEAINPKNQAPNTTIVNNGGGDSKSVGGHKPGNNTGDLAILPVSGSDIRNKTVTGQQLADGTIQMNNLSPSVISALKSGGGSGGSGPQGPAGIQGPVGPAGEQGLQGVQGLQGPPGDVSDVIAGLGLNGGGSNGSITLAVMTGNTTEIVNDAVEVKVASNGTTSTTSSVSGLEASSQGLRLVGGCANGQILKWNGSAWTCSADNSGGGGGSLDVQTSDGNTFVSGITNLQFGPTSNSSNEFQLTNLGGGQVRVQIGNNVLQTTNYSATLDPAYVNTSEAPASGDIVGTFTTGFNVVANAISLGTDTTGNFLADISGSVGIAITGGGSEGATPTVSLDVTTTGTSSTISSNSGLEIGADGLRLIGGCGANELLKWNGTAWLCSSDNSSSLSVEENDVQLIAAATALDFLGNDFSVTNSSGEANIVIDYANSGITRRNQTETINGSWSFNDASFTLQDNADNSKKVILELSGIAAGTTRTLIVPNINGTIITTGNLTDINTVGTITSGLWQGSIIGSQYGGTGVNGSTAANGQLLMGNGSGYTLGTLTQGSGIAITNGSGSITVASTLGTSIGNGEIDNDAVALGTQTTGNYITTLTSGNGLTVSGSGSESAAASILLDVTTSGSTGTTSSNSGLEVAADGLRLISGCGSGEILKWNSTNWVCAADANSGSLSVQENDTTVSGAVSTLDFLGNDFDVSETPAGEGNVSIDYTNSGITRRSSNETIAGSWTFNDSGFTLQDNLDSTKKATFQLSGISASTTRTYTLPDVNGTLVTTGNLTDITSLGTISSGTWQAGIIAVNYGGTGASTFTSNGVLYGNGTGSIQSTSAGTSGQVLLANGSGVPTFASLSGDLNVNSSGATTIQVDAVALGTDTTGNYVAGLTAGNGISVSGSAGEGWSPSVAVLYGSSANTAVQGNTTITCASGTGNLTGGGNSITLGSGGTCNSIDTAAAVSFATSVTTPLVQNAGLLSISSNATAGADDIVFNSAGSEVVRLLENGDIKFERGANDAFFSIATPSGSSATYTFSGASGTVLTTANYTGTLDSVYVNEGQSPAAGDITGSFSGGLNIGANSVALGTDTTGDYVQNLGSLTGLSTSGNSGEGSTPTLAVIYGSAANTAVQGNTTFTCASGTGNLSGGGTTITVGAGGTCGAINTVANPSFGTSVTTPLLTNAGTLTLSTTGSGNDIVLTSADQITLTGFNCSTFNNGGVLTTDSGGNIICQNDDGGAAGSITGSGTANRLTMFNGASTITDSWLAQNSSTLELDNTKNLSLLGGNLSVTGTGLFTGLMTLNGGLTIETGDTFTFNGDAFTDLTGTGLTVSSGALQATLGTSISNGEIDNDAVTLGTQTTGNYVSVLGSLTGLSTTGNSGEGSTPTLAVLYGSSANTAVQGNTSFTCPSGTGNLSGGGTVITMGAGGTCGAINTVATPSFTSVTSGTYQSTGVMSILTSATVGSDDIVFSTAGTESMRILEGGDVRFEKGANDVTFSVATPSGSAATYTFSGATGTVLTTTNYAGNLDATYVNVGENPTAGDITGSFSGGFTINNSAVTNAKLQNGSVTVTAGTGLSGGGAVALGASTSLAVQYGSASGTAVQGNVTLTCTSGTGNLSGGGDVITLGSGGTCSNISISNAPTFTTSVTTPIVQNAGVISVSSTATAGADDIIFNSAGTEIMRLLEGGDIKFERGSNDAFFSVATPSGSPATYTFSGTTGTVLTSANFGASLDSAYVNVGENPASGDISGSFSGGLMVAADSVALGTDTTGNYVATITGNSQLSVSGSGSENAGVSLSIVADSIGDSQLAFDTGQNLTTSSNVGFASTTLNKTLSGTTAADLLDVNLTNNTTSGTQRGAFISNTGGTGVTDSLLTLDNSDTDTAVTAALLIQSAAGTISTAIDLTDADIGTGINLGANDIIGTTAIIDFTNFDVDSAGHIGFVLHGTSDTNSVLCRNSTGYIAGCTALTDAQISDTLTASNFVGSGSTTSAIDLATAEVAGTLGDGNVSDAITISSSGNVDWTALSNYPTACSAGSAVSTLADSPTCTAFNTDTSITLQDAYAQGAAISTSGNDIAFTLNSSQGHTVATAAGATGYTTFSLTDGSNASPPAQLVLITNNDTNQALAAGLKVTSAAGTITAAFDASGSNITNALSIGSNNILTSGATISAAELNLLDAHNVAIVDVDDAVNTAITGTGILGAGSIAAGFGAIDTGADNITTTGTIGTAGTTTFTGAGATFSSTVNADGGLAVNKTLAANSGSTQNVQTISFTTPADSSGTNVAQGLNITPTIGNATAGTNTANIINIDAVTGDAQVTLNAFNVGNLTGTSANEYALHIGTGWDSVLRVGTTDVINGTGQLIASQLTGTLISTGSDSGSSTLIQGDTLAINGGTNGIDTVLSGDTYTINVDTTEIGTTTFGAGSAFTWTFDASAGTDTRIAFGNGTVTVDDGTNTLFSITDAGTAGTLSTNGGTLTNTNTIQSQNNTNLTLDAQGTGSLVFTGYNCTGQSNGGVLNANASGTVICDADDSFSDSRLKKNVADVQDGMLEKLSGIRTVNFNYDCSLEFFVEREMCKTADQTGVVAQELQQMFPELVYETDSGYLAVRYDRLNMYTLKGLQELDQKVNDITKNGFSYLEGEGLSANLRDDQVFAIKDINNDVKASIDANGNAVFDGTVEASNIAQLEQDVAELQSRPVGQNFDLQNLTVGNIRITLDVFTDGSLTVMGDADFKSSVLFEQLATFNGDVELNGITTVNGQARFNNNTGGYAQINPGQSAVRVNFSQAYSQTPVVSLTLGDGKFDKYSYKNLDNTGFDIVLDGPATEQLNFSWLALSVTNPNTYSQQ